MHVTILRYRVLQYTTGHSQSTSLFSILIRLSIDADYMSILLIGSDQVGLPVYQTQRLKEDEWHHPVDCREEHRPIGSSWSMWWIDFEHDRWFDSVDSIDSTDLRRVCIGPYSKTQKNVYLRGCTPKHMGSVRSTANINLNASQLIEGWGVFSMYKNMASHSNRQ
jgi:hypothetical protein